MIARLGFVVILLVFAWGVWTIRMDEVRRRPRPDNPRHEPPKPRCPTCSAPYQSWSYAPPVVGLRGETIVAARHALRCANGHRWSV